MNKILYSAIIILFLAEPGYCASGITQLSPPEMGFYSKEIDYEGIPIKAPPVVVDDALLEAKRRLAIMLHSIPNAVANLKAEGAELHIIGRDQGTSDLPEHRFRKGKPFDGDKTMDQRTRGVGGIFASCGEENLLCLDKDRYHGADICVHEFAHTLMEFGLDEAARQKITQQYQNSIARGLWKTMYAATNEKEFFAELSMWYFGTRGDLGKIPPYPKPGKEWLRTYDPDAYQLIDDIYCGRVPMARIRIATVEPHPPYEEGTIKSLRGDRQSTLRLVNHTLQKVHVFWLDYQGQRKPYGEIEPMGRVIQNTYDTHAFLLADEYGRGLGIFVAVPEPAIGILK